MSTLKVKNPETGLWEVVGMGGGGEVYTKAEVDALLTKRPNPNLLDNWYFGNPVDQREGWVVPPGIWYYDTPTFNVAYSITGEYYVATKHDDAAYKITLPGGEVVFVHAEDVVRGYTGTGYTIDRWSLNGGTLTVVDGGINLTQGVRIAEYFELPVGKALVGKTLTASILVNNSLVASTFELTDAMPYTVLTTIDGWRLAVAGYTATYGLVFQIYNITGGDTDILKAAKLELGTEQTLAHQDADGNWVLNEIPDYGEQLRRCQRYYYTAKNLSIPAFCVEEGNIRFELFCPVELRAWPNNVTGSVNWVFQLDYNSDVTGELQLNDFHGNTLQCSMMVTATVSGKGVCSKGAVLLLINSLSVSADL